jgi:group I intron endonuclease
MYIYKIINKVNGKWYIGKHNGRDPNYFGSGKLLKQAVEKYGKDNFERIILEEVIDDLDSREQFWIAETDAVNDPMSYNLANGGQGGDLSKFIDYKSRQYVPGVNRFKAAREWLDTLTPEERKERFAKQGQSRTKGWFVSRVDDPTETYVQNIAKWCEEHGVDKSMPTGLNNPASRLFQKQTKGWRIRRADMPHLPPYKNRRFEPTNNQCAGRTWKLVNGIRVWFDK